MRLISVFAAIAAVAMTLLGCGSDESQVDLTQQVLEVAERYRDASFSATYDLQVDSPPDDPFASVVSPVEIYKDGAEILVHLKIDDEELFYTSEDQAEGELDYMSCVVRTLVELGETVCFDDGSNVWTAIAMLLVPAVNIFPDLEAAGLTLFDIERLDSRTISDIESECFTTRRTDIEDVEATFCHGESGVLTYQSQNFDANSIELTAIDYSPGASVEIPYRVVQESDLPGGACSPPACVRPD